MTTKQRIAKTIAIEVFLERHKCSWRDPLRRVAALFFSKRKAFAFLPGGDRVFVECAKCGRRSVVWRNEIEARKV